MFRGVVRTIHFVGIGGIGMSGIAEVLLTRGFAVTGSDLREGQAVARLRGLGATVFVGHAPDNVHGADVVVRSTAVSEANVEVAEAIERGIPVIRRAEMLAELMRLQLGVAVAGSHGKTTTTSMIAAVLAAGGLDPTVVIGGRLDSLGGTNARLGQGEWMVAEADESDGSFTLLSPTVALVTNIDPEHLDHYGSVEALESAFEDFAGKVPFYGFAVLCVDHPVVARMVASLRRRVVTYGLARHATVRASDIRPDGVRTRATLTRGHEVLGDIELAMPGVHNIVNATGAVATALELGVPFADIQAALHGFSGVDRRFSVRGVARGVTVVDDYGHHPAEIAATLAAAAAGFPGRRIHAVFQPHRFTRLRALLDDFCSSFNQADAVVVCPVYAAGERPLPGVDADAVVAGLRERGHRGAVGVSDLDEAVARLADAVQPGDLVVTLGAGDVGQVAPRLLAALRAAEAS
jgi:UDP-N-acetylmuramate--alanine ligase